MISTISDLNLLHLLLALGPRGGDLVGDLGGRLLEERHQLGGVLVGPVGERVVEGAEVLQVDLHPVLAEVVVPLDGVPVLVVEAALVELAQELLEALLDRQVVDAGAVLRARAGLRPEVVGEVDAGRIETCG